MANNQPSDPLLDQLARLIRTNLWSDLAAQGATFGLLLVTRSVWIGAAWLIRWGIVAMVWRADRLLRTSDANSVMRWSVTGHCLGSILIVAVIPEAGPIAMLILAGDLFMVVTARVKRGLGSMIVASVGICAALSFQDVTQVSESISPTLGLVAITANALGSAIFVPESMRAFYSLIRSPATELAAAETRLTEAIASERASIAAALAAGPFTDLTVLRSGVCALTDAGAGSADELIVGLQRSLQTLRAISHGTDSLPEWDVAPVALTGSDLASDSNALRPDSFDPVDEGSRRVIDVFTRAGIRLAGLAAVTSAIVAMVTAELSNLLVTLVLVILGAGVWIAGRYGAKGNYARSVTWFSVTSALTGPTLAILDTDLSMVVSLVVLLPILLALPHLTARRLGVVRGVAAIALTSVAAISFIDRSVLAIQPPPWVPLLVVPAACLALARMIASTAGQLGLALATVTEQLQVSIGAVVAQARHHRQTIQHNLHDGAQQQFVALMMRLRILSHVIEQGRDPDKAIDDIVSLIDRTETELFTLGQGAVSPDVAAGRLETALQRLATTVGPRMRFANRSTSFDMDVVPVETAASVYFVCSEAVQNAVKHTPPSTRIELFIAASHEASRLAFRVVDHGAGFASASTSGSSGLQTMEARITRLGGEVRVDSTVGVGTTVSGWVPLGQTEDVAPQRGSQVLEAP